MKRVKAEIAYEPEGEEPSLFTEQSVHQVYFWHHKTDLVMRGVLSSELEGFRLSLAEWLLLGIVSEGPEDGVSLSEIAKHMGVSQPQVTGLMSNITNQKLVRQKVQRRDRRSRHVTLSTRGQHLLSQAEEVITEKMRETLRGIGEKQFAGYCKTVRGLSAKASSDKIKPRATKNKEKKS